MNTEMLSQHQILYHSHWVICLISVKENSFTNSFKCFIDDTTLDCSSILIYFCNNVDIFLVCCSEERAELKTEVLILINGPGGADSRNRFWISLDQDVICCYWNVLACFMLSNRLILLFLNPGGTTDLGLAGDDTEHKNCVFHS